MNAAQTGRTHDLHPTASRKPKESLDPWAPSTHDPSEQRWILTNDGLSVTISVLAEVSYPAFLGRLASLYTLTLAIISRCHRGEVSR